MQNYSQSIYALIVANLFPLFGVMYFHWEIGMVMAIFWLENIVIGVFNLLRMQKVSKSAEDTAVMIFFLFHYGLFTVVHGIFIYFLFISGTIITLWGISVAFLLLCGSHAVSHKINFVEKKEYEHVPIQTLFRQPYRRVVTLHITVLIGGSLIENLAVSMYYPLIILILAKIVVDIFTHLHEHKIFEKLEKELSSINSKQQHTAQ